MKKKKVWPSVLGFIVLIALIVNFITGGSKSSSKSEQGTTSQSQTTQTVSSETQMTSTSSETTTQSQESGSTTLAYDLADMNVRITDSFNEAVQFNKNGADGYEWTVFIQEIKLKKTGALDVAVTNAFNLLSNELKTEVLNSVSRSVNAVIFVQTNINKHYFITAYSNGVKVAISKVFNPAEYKFK